MQCQNVDDLNKNKKSFASLDMQQWATLVNQWDKTQETQQAYCNRLNLNINTFIYVKTKLNRKKPVKSRFIPLTIQPDLSVLNGSSSLIFENQKGIKLSISLSMKESELLHLLKLIGWNHA